MPLFNCKQMSAEQLGQLYELMHATKDVWKSGSANTEESDTADQQSDRTNPKDTN